MASPVVWGTVIATFCYMYFVYFCMTWMPAYFVEKRHLSLDSMGLYTFFSFSGMAVVAGVGGPAGALGIGSGGGSGAAPRRPYSPPRLPASPPRSRRLS